jgi:two-component system nitrate/nitrite response regulator NarL
LLLFIIGLGVIKGVKALSVKVLIVDEYPVVRQGIAGFFKTDPQIEIVGTAVNGLEGLQKTGKLKPVVVITNVSMPIMNGIEATAIIKEEMPNIRVIVLTNALELNVTTRALLAGADICLTKGVQIDRLLQVVKTCTL